MRKTLLIHQLRADAHEMESVSPEMKKRGEQSTKELWDLLREISLQQKENLRLCKKKSKLNRQPKVNFPRSKRNRII